MDGMQEGENKPRNAASAGDSGPPGHSHAVKVLAILVVVGALLTVALPVARVYRQRQAVARVEELGGLVAYDYQYRDGSLDMTAKPAGPKFLRKWLGDDAVAAVAYIFFGGLKASALTDADLEVLPRFPQLTALSTVAGDVGDRGLKYVGQLPNLESLTLAGGNFSDAGLENLKGLTHLREIILHGSGVTDARRRHIDYR
jgi:hypothetical protein